ncbi:hypothetical protein [Alteromonas sp. CYL-A6]|uniref:hypothetical protein n=1 Tax=Alteromonas nitratireducens TaxID=3390813 RepID=UPI0034B8ED4A
MKQHELSIDIQGGHWVVDIFEQRLDDGVYDLIAPATATTLRLDDNTLYGFRYHITAPALTTYKVCLDDTVLAEGVVDDSGLADGRGVL